jgi:hypothetical protein
MSGWRHSFNILSLLLLLAIGATSGFLYYQWRMPSGANNLVNESAANQVRTTPDEGKPGAARFVPISIKAYDEITQRPLFVEGRLPPPEPEKKTVETRIPRKPLRLKLEGVAMMPDNRVAIIRDLDTNELLRVSQGMNKNDWKVESVDSQSATIVRKGERLILKLEIEEDSTRKGKPPLRSLPFIPSNR